MFGLLHPLFLILLNGLTEFGRASMTKNIITGATREAVRIYALVLSSGNVTTAKATAIMSSVNLDPRGRTKTFDYTGAKGLPLDDIGAGTIRADINCNFTILGGFLSRLCSDSIPLAASISLCME